MTALLQLLQPSISLMINDIIILTFYSLPTYTYFIIDNRHLPTDANLIRFLYWLWQQIIMTNYGMLLNCMPRRMSLLGQELLTFLERFSTHFYAHAESFSFTLSVCRICIIGIFFFFPRFCISNSWSGLKYKFYPSQFSSFLWCHVIIWTHAIKGQKVLRFC